MNVRRVFVMAYASLILTGATQASTSTITQWNFSTMTAAPDNSPSPDGGAGVASVLGMDNNYTFSGSPLRDHRALGFRRDGRRNPPRFAPGGTTNGPLMENPYGPDLL